MNEFYGDVVLYEGNDWDSKLVRLFTQDKFTHSGLRINEKEVLSITWREEEILNLEDLQGKYSSALILRHKKITQTLRDDLRKAEESLVKNYSLLKIFELGFSTIFDSRRNELTFGRGHTCSGRIASIYDYVGLGVRVGFPPRQTIPSDFLRGGYFEQIGYVTK